MQPTDRDDRCTGLSWVLEARGLVWATPLAAMVVTLRVAVLLEEDGMAKPGLYTLEMPASPEKELPSCGRVGQGRGCCARKAGVLLDRRTWEACCRFIMVAMVCAVVRAVCGQTLWRSQTTCACTCA